MNRWHMRAWALPKNSIRRLAVPSYNGLINFDVPVRYERTSYFSSREFHNSTLRSDRPAFASRREGDTIKVLLVEHLPIRAVVGRRVGTGRTDGDPSIFRPSDAG